MSLKLQKIVKEQRIKGIIIGFPMTYDNEPTLLAHEIINISNKININIMKKRLIKSNSNEINNENELHNSLTSLNYNIITVPIPYTYWDERNSTSYGRNLASILSNNKKKFKENNKDTYAASVILYSFLNQMDNNLLNNNL